MEASEIRNYLAANRSEVMDILDQIYLDGEEIPGLLTTIVNFTQESAVKTFLYYVPNNDGTIRVESIDDLLRLPWSETWGFVIREYCKTYQEKVAPKRSPWIFRKYQKITVGWFFKTTPTILQEAILYRAM